MSEDSDDQSQKTEDPTEHRLEESIKKGQLPISRELTHLLMLATITGLFLWVVPSSLTNLFKYTAYLLEHAHLFPQNFYEMQTLTHTLGLQLFQFFSWIFLSLMIVGILGYALQTRGIISSQSLQPKFSKISPAQGFKRLFGKQSFVEFFKNLIKLTLIISVAWTAFGPEHKTLNRLIDLPIYRFFNHMEHAFIRFMVWVLSILSAITVLDYFYQRYAWRERLKMTLQEVKDERKELEGNPQIKSRMRQIAYERARRRVMSEVPKATVLITNPTHFAVALKYESGQMQAPILTAKGADALAFKMREVAREHNIPIVEDPPVARGLFKDVKEETAIPIAYYEPVAKIIRYILSQNKRP